MQHAPGYVDLQVNGYAGVDFNADNVTAEQLHDSCRQLRDDGVAGILATIITDELEAMANRLRRLVALRQADPLVADVIWGFHIEGPFIHPTPGYVGAHPPQCVRLGDIERMKPLLDAAEGLTRIVTLAPECDPGMKLTRWLADRNIIVSAGHCDPNLDQLHAAIDAGLSMFTHLGNGCPMMMHRHDNIVQRVLSLRESLTLCFIADGIHIPVFALGNYLRLAGIERSIVVTDAIAAARLGPGRYTLGGQNVDVGDDLACRAADGSHFVGSTATMLRMAALLRDQLQLSMEDVDMLVIRNPRVLLGG